MYYKCIYLYRFIIVLGFVRYIYYDLFLKYLYIRVEDIGLLYLGCLECLEDVKYCGNMEKIVIYLG